MVDVIVAYRVVRVGTHAAHAQARALQVARRGPEQHRHFLLHPRRKGVRHAVQIDALLAERLAVIRCVQQDAIKAPGMLLQ